jgi:uncharacterized protein
MTTNAAGRGFVPAMAALLLILVAVNVVIDQVSGSSLLVGPVAAIALVALSRWYGLSFGDLGLARDSWPSGARYGAVVVALVVLGYLVAALLPATREAFLDTRYDVTATQALLRAFVVIPLGTVLFEEVAFRGVLWGLVNRAKGPVTATVTSSVLFGFWHVLPSLSLASTNTAIGDSLEPGTVVTSLVVGSSIVVFTALAGVVFCELRRRSGSLLAPMALHWATNGLGVLTSAVLWGTQA